MYLIPIDHLWFSFQFESCFPEQTQCNFSLHQYPNQWDCFYSASIVFFWKINIILFWIVHPRVLYPKKNNIPDWTECHQKQCPHHIVIIYPTHFWGRKSILQRGHFSYWPEFFQLVHQFWYDICAEKIREEYINISL